jgi:hypothetical protein
MAGVGNLVVVPATGAPPVPAAPQLSFSADPGTITGWLLDATATETSSSISQGLELGFNCLFNNVPDPADATYDDIMCTMTDEILGSDTLVTYLVITNAVNDQARGVTLLHSIGKYSAGFGGSNTLHGSMLGLLGKMVDNQLPRPSWLQRRPDVGPCVRTTPGIRHCAIRCTGGCLFCQSDGYEFDAKSPSCPRGRAN